jgi:hypothetical protein
VTFFALAAMLFCVAAFFVRGIPGGTGAAAVGAPGRQPAASPSPFELVAYRHRPGEPRPPEADANCLLLNPRWGWQVNNPPADPANPEPNNFPDGIFQCRPDYSDCSGNNGRPETDFVPKECVMCRMGNNPKKDAERGHVNWFPATYTGTLCFHNFSYPDMDYTFSLQPDGGGGLTRWNPPAEPDLDNPGHAKKTCRRDGKEFECPPQAFHVEFDSRETAERFRTKTWTDFRKLASPCKLFEFSSCKPAEARKMIESKRAVVLGLVGLDSVHNIYSELHPVYGIAIEMEEKETTENGVPVVDSKWIVFARDEGNEGACSFKPHPLYGPGHKPLETLKLLIPPPPGLDVTGASYLEGTGFYSNNGTEPDAAYHDSLFAPDGGDPYARNNKGVLLTFDLRGCREGAPSPCTPLIEGEINLRWRVAPAPGAQRFTRLSRFDACIKPEGYEEEEKLQRKPTPRQASQLFQLLLKARAEGLTMGPAKRAYEGAIPNARPLGACASVLTTVRQQGPERFSRFSFPGGPFADIIDILGRP